MPSSPEEASPVASQSFDVIIVGAGLSGIAMGRALKENGFERFIILERAEEVGGVWRDNKYPGCAVDVPVHFYSYSFKLNPDWTEPFASWRELQGYISKCADDLGIRKHIRFNSKLKEAKFDGNSNQWRITTDQGDDFASKFLILATGGLSNPAIPEIEGTEQFRGQAVHSMHWDPNWDVRGKNVAVIGTGASAIQIIPSIAGRVNNLYVFQRTPAWIIPKGSKKYRRTTQLLFRFIPGLMRVCRFLIYVRVELRQHWFSHMLANKKNLDRLQEASIRHLRNHISDEHLRAKLTPNYRIGCKRILYSDDFYSTMAKKNVHLITDKIRNVSATSVVTLDGKHHAVDLIIFGTGFRAVEHEGEKTSNVYQPYSCIGRDEADLFQGFAKNGASAYRGVAFENYPNLFMIGGPNTGLGSGSLIYMFECQVNYITSCLKYMRSHNFGLVELRHGIGRDYNRDIDEKMGSGTVWANGGCTSYYMNKSGRVQGLWPSTMLFYWLTMRRFDLFAYRFSKDAWRHSR